MEENNYILSYSLDIFHAIEFNYLTFSIQGRSNDSAK